LVSACATCGFASPAGNEHMKLHRIIVIALTLQAIGSVWASAQPRSDAPYFSEGERQIIARNALLRRRLASDPWVVRRAIDVLTAEPEERRNASDTEGGKAMHSQPGESARGKRANPDIENLVRSSPEAAYDLLKLLKRVGTSSPKPPAK
jgi:hypothetical protein